MLTELEGSIYNFQVEQYLSTVTCGYSLCGSCRVILVIGCVFKDVNMTCGKRVDNFILLI